MITSNCSIHGVPLEEMPILKGKTELLCAEWDDRKFYYLVSRIGGNPIFSEFMDTESPARYLAERGIFL